MSVRDQVKSALKSHDRLYQTVVGVYGNSIYPWTMSSYARKFGISVRFHDKLIEVAKGNNVIRLAKKHLVYCKDIIDGFDLLWSAVNPVECDDKMIIDYSTPTFHSLRGYDRHPIFLPSFAEPIELANQYLDFANLGDGSVAIDLGAYSGLTSIVFREQCGDSGRVVAVDADRHNIYAIRKNFAQYELQTGRKVELLEGAVWVHDNGIHFASEGAMASSATEIVGDRLNDARLVPSYRLSSIADKFGLTRVDFIKADVEGAEAVLFQDPQFFRRFRPRIIVEVHPVDGKLTTGDVRSALDGHGYECREVPQPGSHLPLLECVPGERPN